MSIYGYVRIPLQDRGNFDEEAIREELGADDKIYYDIIVATKGVNPNFWDMLKKAHKYDKIVVRSIAKLGLTNNSLYDILVERWESLKKAIADGSDWAKIYSIFGNQ